MAGGSSALPWAPIEALGVLMELLSEVENATPSSSEFYDRVCEATCQLAHLRRAVIFLYDDARREVRAVGSSDVPLELFTRARVKNATNVPIARAALVGDCVVEVHDHFEDHIPAELVAELQPRNLVCSPMSAGGLWFGALIGEREADRLLTDAERHTLWTLGKVAGLAASARIATRQQERSRRLTERIDLARELHDSVIQRLFAVGMVLGAEGPLTDEDRARANDEVHVAASELRAAMQRPLARLSSTATSTLAEVLENLEADHPDLGLRTEWQDGVEVPARFESLAQNVLAEAVRNARKHAESTTIVIALEEHDDTIELRVSNDGVIGSGGRSGMGLRMAALEALHHGALVDFGPETDGRWRVRLVMPLEEEA
ncbi:MAG TPA: histidine kinase [Solirubrobacteraceae bacterium]|nr:histidine kinase [Solirubrobacteraceae bacterium]